MITPLSAKLASFNPSTGDLLAEVAVDGVDEIERKVRLARASSAAWRALSVRERADRVRAALPRLRAAEEELSRAITREVGKTLREARHEVAKLAHTERTLCELERALEDELLVEGALRSTISRRGFGVAAAIAPWNYPVLMPHRLIVPALVAGNAVLFKPSEYAPVVGQLYADALGQHLPDGVLQVVQGGASQGAALVERADLVAFVGSRAVGKGILERGAGSLTRVVLELGGSDPLLVLADAELELAVDFAVRNAFRNAGQACTCTRRVLVAQELYPAFESALIARSASVRVGDAFASDVDVGPLVGPSHKARFLEGVARAERAGATLLCGGDADGNFVRPMVLRAPLDIPLLGAEELFGPCVFLSSFRAENDAIRAANATVYGLGASVFSRDVLRAGAIAAQLDAGMVGINGSCLGAQGAPWVGSKESGYGYHGSASGHRQFAQTHVVTTHANVSGPAVSPL